MRICVTVSIHLASLHPVDARLTETGHTRLGACRTSESRFLGV
jgi:hypothetical protein